MAAEQNLTRENPLAVLQDLRYYEWNGIIIHGTPGCVINLNMRGPYPRPDAQVHYQLFVSTAKEDDENFGKIVGNYRFDETKETSNETKGLKRKAGILQKMEDFEDSKRSP
ncbi:hypothetical protein Tco_1506522 [Tanacetum coccineum]